MKLRNKFFLVLVGVPTLAVFILLFVSIQVFVEDKKLFIFESQLENAHLLARQIISELKAHPGQRGSIQSIEAFNSANYSDKFLIDTSHDHLGEIIASSVNKKNQTKQSIDKIDDYLNKSTIDKISDLSTNEGSFEDFNQNQEAAMFSFIRLPEEKMVLILQTPKTSAFRASTIFILKGLLTLVGLILSSLLASLLLSKSMTKNLTTLEASMRNFGEGNLNTNIQVQSQDEIGKLGEYFNKMVSQIKSLMIEQQEKIKLEFEMDMAGKLQSRFFPSKDYTSENVSFSGFYQPSSQCGGDWWYYFIKGDQFVAFMGDVTGHGVKSALMTSASRSIFALIEDDFIDTAQSMNILNRSFFAAAIGEVNMSAIIMSLNTKTGELEYTNASHDPSWVFSSQQSNQETNSKFKYTLLDELHGMRLGTVKNTTYNKTKIQLEPGSTIFTYTDGLLEITNKNGRPFNDRMIIKTWSELNTDLNYQLTHTQSEFQQKLINYSNGLTNLSDDLSYFFIRYQGHKDITQRSTHAS